MGPPQNELFLSQFNCKPSKNRVASTKFTPNVTLGLTGVDEVLPLSCRKVLYGPPFLHSHQPTWQPQTFLFSRPVFAFVQSLPRTPSPELYRIFCGCEMHVAPRKETMVETMTCYGTVDGQNPAPPKKPWNVDSPVNSNNQCFLWFQRGAKWISQAYAAFTGGMESETTWIAKLLPFSVTVAGVWGKVDGTKSDRNWRPRQGF